MSGQYKSSDTVELVLSECGQGEESDEYDQPPEDNATPKTSSNLRLLFLVFLVVLSALTLTLALSAQKQKVWLDLVRDDGRQLIVGQYRLDSFGADFDQYLLSLNIPKHVIPLIRNTSERVEIRGPEEDDNGTWTITLTTDYGEHTLRFQLGLKFRVSHNEDSSSLQHLCTRPQSNVLDCRTEALARGWSIRSRMIFSHEGFVEEIKNLNTDLGTTKTFVRIEQERGKKEEVSGAKKPEEEGDIWEY